MDAAVAVTDTAVGTGGSGATVSILAPAAAAAAAIALSNIDGVPDCPVNGVGKLPLNAAEEATEASAVCADIMPALLSFVAGCCGFALMPMNASNSAWARSHGTPGPLHPATAARKPPNWQAWSNGGRTSASGTPSARDTTDGAKEKVGFRPCDAREPRRMEMLGERAWWNE
jgi:hypothetical protein